MDMSKFYLEGYKGEAVANTEVMAAGAYKRLPDIPCKFVKLARWNASDDTNFTVAGPDYLDTDDEIYYGFDSVLFGQLFISQTTDLIPVSNAKQILLHVPQKTPGPVTIHYVIFK